MKQNPNYIYYNQPFSLYSEGSIKKVSYQECISNSNVFIKSEVTNFVNLKITKEQLVKDFDKILTISRRDKKNQSISFILAQKNTNFLNKTKRKYYLEDISEETFKRIETYLNECDTLLEDFKDITSSHFLYEDLFYGDISKLFNYLELEYIEKDFNEILDSSNKYKHGEIPSKKNKTLI